MVYLMKVAFPFVEERRLFYVAMTCDRRKLHILHIALDFNCQLLQPSRFLSELPHAPL